MQISTAEYRTRLKNLRKDLKGHYKEIADACGVSLPSVWRVLQGDWYNEAIINKAIEIRDRKKNELAELLEKMSH